jgi:hypothetical protein
MQLLDDKRLVDERQIDFMILEELACSPPFARWFLGQTGHTGAGTLELLRLLHGSAVLLVVHAIATGSRALFIETKAGAAFTRSQPERHRIRGQAGVVAGCWQEFATVLAAPQHYLTDVAQGVFNHKIPFETIGQAIEAHGDPARIACKLKLLDCAIAKVHHERPKKTPRSYWRGADISR